MKKPSVTVLLVTYNHINTFEKAIQSVLSQKTTFPVTIIILDDASTDGTVELINKYKNLENVKCILREKNAGGTTNIYEGLKLVNTKYFAALETDDYWCDENKLQTQVDILEKHPECSFCAHNTLVKYAGSSKTRYYIKDVPDKIFKFPPEEIKRRYYIEPHPSSRLYRTECLNLEEIKNPVIATYDVATNFYFLTKGNLYYLNKVMSVYNCSGSGVYSGVSSYRQRYKTASVILQLNKEFGFKYNRLLSRFFSTRLNLNFLTYLRLRYSKNPENLDKMYDCILENYEKKYLNNRDKKPVCYLSLPLSKKSSLVLELRREKDRA